MNELPMNVQHLCQYVACDVRESYLYRACAKIVRLLFL
jgi:hypothetical protein